MGLSLRVSSEVPASLFQRKHTVFYNLIPTKGADSGLGFELFARTFDSKGQRPDCSVQTLNLVGALQDMLCISFLAHRGHCTHTTSYSSRRCMQFVFVVCWQWSLFTGC